MRMHVREVCGEAMKIFMTCHLESIALGVKLSAAARQVCSIADQRRTVERWDLSRWRAASLCVLKLTLGKYRRYVTFIAHEKWPTSPNWPYTACHGGSSQKCLRVTADMAH
jgi:hypothetical protein